jgi:hypothetical protein
MSNIKIELTIEEVEALNGLLTYEIETQGSLSKEIKSIYKKLKKIRKLESDVNALQSGEFKKRTL